MADSLPDASLPYHLIYWPTIPGRGEFPRLLLEEASAPYTDIAREDIQAAVAKVLENNAAINPTLSPEATAGFGGNPAIFAPPILQHGSLTLSQLPAIILYIATRTGLSPPPSSPAYHHLHAIALTLLDGFVVELHDTHHPINMSAYYDEQKDEALKRATYFKNERIPKFLAYLQRVLDSDVSGEGWLYGNKLTYVDLVLFQCLHGTEYAFPKTIAKARKSGKYDGVFKLYEAVSERPKVKAYMTSERRIPYADGVWRHYPEFEADD